MTFIVLLNAVLVESEGELGVCFPPRQTTRNKKGVYIIINNNDFYRVLLNAVFEGELEVCLPPRQTARNEKGVYIIINNNDFYCVLLNVVLVESEGKLGMCLPSF